jgi:hypothetical protein
MAIKILKNIITVFELDATGVTMQAQLADDDKNELNFNNKLSL